MHILQINAVSEIRSTGRFIKELDEYLIRNEYKSSVAFSEGILNSRGYKIGTKLEKKIHGLCSRITGLQGYFSKNGTRKLLNHINKINPDIVHIHNLHSNFINMPMLFKYLAKNDIATVITLHDCWFYTGGHTHYVTDNFYDWETGFFKKNRNKKLTGNKSWFFDQSEKIFNDQKKWFMNIPRLTFVGVSGWITEEAKKSEVAQGSTIQTIHNWIDIETFRPTNNTDIRDELNIQFEFIILGVASAWTNKKGLDNFIELSKNIKDDECVILIGKVDKHINLPDNIINVPETHNVNKLVAYYSLADVFINLSLEESFGKVTAEALSCGTPAISIDSTANAEIIGEGCGYIIKDWNLNDILSKIDIIRFDGKYTYTDNCIKFIREKFDSKEKLKKYKQLYENIILK
ncbi:Glycosyltransferase involved in cell wall bisynthesis [Carnobacterium iners]|uniref:Glycosyltransferase involved in cell wall bisynthesis n=1 Tax=Carnobacterium iners TaxID=1073423 RepID=A0A1X7NAL1_9LACT|nr:glycosyltransferase [Carnobacterium iners]SEL32495.1 Glycosyltransferase involved in cell wall bisynthesis [Carnobacterium iners]SMH33930.1 Glycosyltransferase involved in cell wall bisynthesis [Carnobacterium iners]